jgi:hypothetical protein
VAALVAGLGLFGCSSDDSMMTGGATGVAGQSAVAGSSAAVGAAGSVATPPVTGAGTGAAGTGAAGRLSTSPGVAGSGGAAAGSGAVAGASAAGSGGSSAAGASAGSGGAGALAGAGGSSAAGAAGSPEAGSGGAAAAMHEDLGKGDGKDVVTIGDSWMNLIVTGIEPSLDKASGQRYRHYAVPGTLVLNEQIPNQFKSAVQENPDVKTIVMTGGGNDILTSSCADEACNSIVDDVGKRLETLLLDMNDAGVQDVVIIGYTYPADMTKHESLDHSREVSLKTCVPTSMPRCHFVDSSKLDFMLQDGIHPNAAGCDLIAKTVFDLMTSEGMRR